MFALQYIAAEGGYKITVDEEKCSQDAVRRRQQKNSLRQTCILWTPDKQEHFEGSVSEELRPRSKRRKWIGIMRKLKAATLHPVIDKK